MGHGIYRRLKSLYEEGTTEVGPYTLVQDVGVGAFGTVFEAVHHETGERVALKELARAGPDDLARFKQEFRGLQHLHHPNLVKLRELVQHDGRWLIAMEYVEGTDWTHWLFPESANDNAPQLAVTNLLHSLQGVVEGLMALHDAGFVHRDLKPANVRVTPEGRAVLLDFGLITTTAPDAQSTHGEGVGTVAYMAPEQAVRLAVSPAADWYALGVCLYEALTGRMPFEGKTEFQVMLAKQNELPSPPTTRHRGVPAGLDALCMALLATDPDKRAAGPEVLQWLSSAGLKPNTATLVTALAPSLRAGFTGRAAELEVLENNFARTLQGEARQVFIEGESGIGKSALIEEFVRSVQRQHPDALILRGRCYENETVPFKGFDGITDALARYLRRLPEEECAALLPPWAKLLEQLFPVMGLVKPVVRATLVGAPAEPTARRTAAIDTLRDLFVALRKQSPVLLVADDLQWADTETFKLFDAFVRHPQRPPLLLVFACRPQRELGDDLGTPLSTLREAHSADLLPLRGLLKAETRELAAKLLGAGFPSDMAPRLAEESQGHPLFVAELVEHARNSASGDTIAEATLDGVLASRVRALCEDERALLDMVALCLSPTPTSVLFAALGRGSRAWSDVLGLLRARKLLGTGRRGRVQCYHDRVRRAVLDCMEPERAREGHAALARALESEGDADAAEVGQHYDRAGRPDQALTWLERGAEQALDNLGFARAVALYTRCLELATNVPTAETRSRLLIGCGHALGRSGHSARAAWAFQTAAELVGPERSGELRVWAAQHLLQAAQIQRGLSAAAAALEDMGVALPSSNFRGMSIIAYNRARASLGKLEEITGDSSTASPEQVRALDALSDLSMSVGWADPLGGAALTAQHLRRSLSGANRRHAVYALAGEAQFRAIQNSEATQRYLPMLERARDLARDSGDPELIARVEWAVGQVELFREHYAQAEQHLRSAELCLVEDYPGAPFLLTNVRATLGGTWIAMGRHALLVEESATWLKEAEDRSDVFARIVLTTMGGAYVRHLLNDQPDRGLSELAELLALWPEEPFTGVHFGEVMATIYCKLYGNHEEAWGWVQSQQRRFDRALMLRVGGGRQIRAAMACAAAVAACKGQPQQARGAALRALRSASIKSAGSFGEITRAQVVALSEGPEAALPVVRNCHARLSEQGVFARWGMHYLEGLLIGGDRGSEMRRAALAAFEAQGYRNTHSALRSWGLPALDALQAKFASAADGH